jgi:hypothetical protein
VLTTLARRTVESASGSLLGWTTPRAIDAFGIRANKALTDPTCMSKPTLTHQAEGMLQNPHVRRKADEPRLWPTATATDAANGQSTPTATPYGTNQGGSAGRTGKVRPSLEGQARGDWATPMTRDWRSGLASEETHARNARPLSEQVTRLSSAESSPDPESDSASGKRRDWPTPTASLAEGGHGIKACSETGVTPTGTKASVDLSDMAKRHWPTPNAEHEATGYLSGSKRDTFRPTLRGAALGVVPTLHDATRQRPRGSLNPDWVGQLMGAPDGWLATDPPRDVLVSAPGATASTRRSSPNSDGPS